MLKTILNFIFPPCCAVCGKEVSENGQLCNDCWNKFDWISDPKCKKCGYPFPANIDNEGAMLCPNCLTNKSKLDWMRSACVYDDVSRNIILPFKHADKLDLKDLMSRSMLLQIKHDLPETAKDFIIMPVPLAYKRLWKRGYNQATLLTKPIAKAFGAEIDYDSVLRFYRPDMGHKSARQRKENIKGVFVIKNPEKIKGKSILIVDDVFTTGATFEELATILKKSGAIWVGGITFARVVKAI